MILRNAAVRSGRRAFASPVQRSCLRCLSTETTTSSPSNTPAPLAQSVPASTPPALSQTPSQPPQRWGARAAAVPDTVAQDYIAMTKLQKKTSKLGSVVEQRYRPGELLKDPPAPKDISLELLMASQTHMGHNTSLWNPANSRYIYGVRQGIHIISLEQTAAYLRRAARVVEEVAYRGGLILFVGTRKGQMEIVVRAAELAGACHLFTKWTPGTITNRDQILASGALRVVDEQDRDLEGFDSHLQERRPLVPDLVVVLNPLENFVLLHECAMANIPTVGVIDTDADPTRVTYTIPANDDSLRSVAVIAGILGRAGELGQKRRVQDAKNGVVSWQTPSDVSRYIEIETGRKAQEALHAKEDAAVQKRMERERLKAEEDLKQA